MPSSVVFAALVLAWLVVLVPVVARRRQMVPRTAEADLSARVLPRTAVGASPERTSMAKVAAPKVSVEEVPVANATSVRRDGAAGSLAPSGGATALAEREHDVDSELDRELELDAHDGEFAEPVDEPVEELQPDREPSSRERVLHRGGDDEYSADDAEYDDDYWDEDWDGEDGETRAYRPGRGGFDPEAAEAAAHARYAFRQRVALGLIAVAVLSALAALVVTPALWWLHVVTDLALVGYLVFLRRQTRIEEEVRTRRAARQSGERRAIRARRERQAVHEDRMAAHHRETESWGTWSEDGDDAPVEEWDDDEAFAEPEPAPRWAAPRTPAPPVPAGMELVDDSDEDPAFHRLDGRDCVPSYRRAAAGA